MYFVAQPHEYLAITGSGISTVKITKKAFVWPLQRVQRFSVQPQDYAMSLQAMTKEKLQFLLPCVFTIGPNVNERGANANQASHHNDGQNEREDRGDALTKFAMLLADVEQAKQGSSHVENIVKGVIEGETRVLVSSMTMEEIFTEREEFKRRIFRNIQSELDQFGLKIYNANVKELKDAAGSTYFQSLAQKAHEGATQTARVDVSEARLRGTVGEAEREGAKEQRIAKIHAETAVLKTERDIEKATAEARLEKERTELDRAVKVAQQQAQRSAEAQDEELKKAVEQKRAEARLEEQRAREVVKATVEREAAQQKADAEAYGTQRKAEAALEAKKRDADAAAYKTRAQADADRYAAEQRAAAELSRKTQEAEGVAAMARAYQEMGAAFGGPQGLLQFVMLEKGTYGELARANAEAVRGMEPKISIWNTGESAGGGAGGEGGGQQQGQRDGTNALRNMYQMLPPLMSTIHDQTGIRLPEWQFGTMAGAYNQGPAPAPGQELQQRGGKQQVNGDHSG